MYEVTIFESGLEADTVDVGCFKPEVGWMFKWHGMDVRVTGVREYTSDTASVDVEFI